MLPMAWFSTTQFSAENTGSILMPLFRWLLPQASEPQLALLHTITRKTAHVAEYAVLCTFWFVALTRERGLARRRAAWIALLVCVGWGCLDELHQATVPSRTSSTMDVAFDGFGAFLAAMIGHSGGERMLEMAATLFLWMVAAGGAAVIAIGLAAGVPSGVLWLTVPAAVVALALRRRATARG
jgi:VanZ family protein